MADSYVALIGVVVASSLTFYGVLRKSRSDERTSSQSASAAEVEKMGARLDKQAEQLDDQGTQIDELRSVVRGLRDYIAADHDDHRRNDWAIRPLPTDLA